MRPRVAVIAAGLIAGTSLAGCGRAVVREPTIPAAPARSAVFSSVGVEPKTLKEEDSRTAVIRYTLDQPASVTVDLVNEDGFLVRRLSAGRQRVGANTVAWDGAMEGGRPAPGGVYRYVIQARGRSGESATYDPSSESGGEELLARDFTFDKKTGIFRWIMPKAGRVWLRIGLEGFPHLRMLLDGKPLEGGEQTLVWDGLDKSGLVRLSEHPRLSVRLSGYTLAPNTILVEGPAGGFVPSGPPAYPPETGPGKGFIHARHPRSACREVRFRVEFPGAPTGDDGRPVLQGMVPVRVVLDPDNAAELVNQKFEVALFEDLTSVFEEEDGTNPFTYLWDTRRLPPGEYLFTVNILSYQDHFGVETRSVTVKGSS